MIIHRYTHAPAPKRFSLSIASSYTLRPATQADQPAIKAIIRASHINPIGLKWPRFILAVTADNSLIGCGQVKPHHDGSRELASIAVVPAWRNQGIAAAIINHLLAHHAPPLWLTCTSELIPLYQKFGFVEIKEPAHMPPYFRRIFRLSQLLLHFAKTDRYLAVMLWSGGNLSLPASSRTV